MIGAKITKHSKSKSQPSSFYHMFNIFLNLHILANYRAKVSEGLSLWYLLTFNSHKSYITTHIPIEVAILAEIPKLENKILLGTPKSNQTLNRIPRQPYQSGGFNKFKKEVLHWFCICITHAADKGFFLMDLGGLNTLAVAPLMEIYILQLFHNWYYKTNKGYGSP